MRELFLNEHNAVNVKKFMAQYYFNLYIGKRVDKSLNLMFSLISLPPLTSRDTGYS